jgi:SAM-dependent methyltransferase
LKTYSSIPADERRSNVECNLCGSFSRKILWDCDTYSFSKCDKCRLIYQYPQPVQKDLSLRYDDNYFDYEIENEEAFYGLMLKTLEDLDFFDRSSSMLSKNAEFLDVGCATGRLLEYMESLGWHGRGVELCRLSAEFGRDKRNLDIFNGTLLEAEYFNNQFSVVHSSHLIEHLTDPAEYIKENYRIIKPGGFFITTTPNVNSLQAILFGSNWRSAIADHMYLFSPGTLSRLIMQEGFRIIQTGTWGGIAQGLVPDILKKSADVLAKKMGFGDVLVILAQKPL